MNTIKFYYSCNFFFFWLPKINFRDLFLRIFLLKKKRHNEHLLSFLSLFSFLLFKFHNCWRNCKKYFLNSLARLFLKLQLCFSNAACNLAVGKNMKKWKHFWLAIFLSFLKLCICEGKNARLENSLRHWADFQLCLHVV
jgi:hypothetical protein